MDRSPIAASARTLLGRGAVLGLALSAGAVFSGGHAQTTIRVHTGTGITEAFGAALTTVGDVDADGTSDYAIAAPNSGPFAVGTGRVLVISGAGGQPLLGLTGATGEHLGWSMSGGLDASGDGVPDLACGIPGLGGVNGAVRLFSGASGLPLFDIPGPAPGKMFAHLVLLADVDGVPPAEIFAATLGWTTAYVYDASGNLVTRFQRSSADPEFGRHAAAAGDVDQDGWTDFAISGSHGPGHPSIWSGRTGLQIRPLVHSLVIHGGPLAGAGDLDGDGIGDVVAQARIISGVAGAALPAFTAFSGATGVPLWSIPRDPLLHLGDVNPQRIAVLGDLDGDGRREIAIGALATTGWPFGFVTIHSGGDGRLLSAVKGDNPWFGTNVAAAGDVDGDARTDILAASIDPILNFGPPDRVAVISARTTPTGMASAVVLAAPCPAGIAAWPLLSIDNVPRLGSLITLTLARAPGTCAGVLAAHPSWPNPAAVAGTCLVWPDLAAFASWVLVPFSTDAAGGAAFTSPIPNVAPLAGLPATLQALIIPDGAVLPVLSSGLLLVFGS